MRDFGKMIHDNRIFQMIFDGMTGLNALTD